MVALQIAREPLVRQVLRQTFQERGKINVVPSKKGRKASGVLFDCISFIEYFGFLNVHQGYTKLAFVTWYSFSFSHVQEVDEAHYAYAFKYLKNKLVKELRDDQFLKMCIAEEEGLISIEINIDMKDVEG